MSEDPPVELPPIPPEIFEAVKALMPKLVVMFRDDPKLMEVNSFVFAGRDLDGDVRVACWELTEDMVTALLDDIRDAQHIHINEPRRSQ